MADIFYNAIKQDLTMVKNDTLQFGFQIVGLKGETPQQIKFTVKNNPDDSEYLIQKTLNYGITLREYDAETDILTYSIRVAPGDTNALDVGRYYYDLQVEVNLDVLTLMKGRLNLEYEVTSGQAPEPAPEYEDGDPVQYPRADIEADDKKVYTEIYISDIAARIDSITGNNQSYTTQEMSGALDDINVTLANLSFTINMMLNNPGADPIPLDEMGEKITDIQRGIATKKLSIIKKTYTETE